MYSFEESSETFDLTHGAPEGSVKYTLDGEVPGCVCVCVCVCAGGGGGAVNFQSFW